MNLKKSYLVPSVKVQWLGIYWVTALAFIDPPVGKREEIQRVLSKFMRTPLSHRHVERILGKLHFDSIIDLTDLPLLKSRYSSFRFCKEDQ